jgi:hypothetical protein
MRRDFSRLEELRNDGILDGVNGEGEGFDGITELTEGDGEI